MKVIKNIGNYWNFLATNPYQDLPEQLAREYAITVTGKGIKVDCEEEDLLNYFNKFIEDNDLNNKLKLSVYYQDLYGGSIMFMLPKKDGTFTVQVTPYTFNSRGVNYMDDLTGVHIRYFPNLADTQEWTEITYTTKMVKYEKYSQMESIGLDGIKMPIPDSKKIKESWVLPLSFQGKIPAKVTLHREWPLSAIVNNSLTPMIMNNCYNTYNLVYKVNRIWEINFKELDYNRTRLAVSADAKTFKRMQSEMRKNKVGIDDLDLYLLDVSNQNSNYVGSSVHGTTIMQGNPLFENYLKLLEYVKIQVWEADGMNYRNPEDGEYKNKTTAVKEDDLTIKTVAIERPKNLPYWLFDILQLIMFPNHPNFINGKARPYTLLFEESQALNEVLKIDNMTKLLDYNLISPIEAISRLDGVNIQQATNKFDKIMENMKKMQKIMPQENNQEGDNQNAESDYKSVI